jgi:hypothetical protein
VAEIGLRTRPPDWRSLVDVFFERRPKGDDGLFQPLSAKFALAEHPERTAKIVLHLGPTEWRTLAGTLRERLPITGNGLLKAGIIARALAKHR